MRENAGKIRTRITPNTDISYVVLYTRYSAFFNWFFAEMYSVFSYNEARLLVIRALTFIIRGPNSLFGLLMLKKSTRGLFFFKKIRNRLAFLTIPRMSLNSHHSTGKKTQIIEELTSMSLEKWWNLVMSLTRLCDQCVV